MVISMTLTRPPQAVFFTSLQGLNPIKKSDIAMSDTAFHSFRLWPSLGLHGRIDRADVSASAAFDASIGIDVVLRITL